MIRHANVLVTGGAGYAGSVVVPRLLAAGHRVRILDLFLFGEEPLRSIDPEGQVARLHGDVRDPETVARAMAGCDDVIHLAGISDAASFDFDPLLGHSVNLRGFACVIEAARHAGVRRVVHVSTTDVYGNSPGRAQEETLLQPHHSLARCAALVEELARAARGQGLPVTTLRVAPLCGWSPRLRLDLPLNDLVARGYCLQELPEPLVRECHSGLHVADLADLLAATLQWPDEDRGSSVYNVAAAIDLPSLLRVLNESLGLNGTFKEWAGGSSLRPEVSTARLAREYGWRPRHAPASVVTELSARLAEGQTPEILSNPRYRNVETLRRLPPDELRRAA